MTWSRFDCLQWSALFSSDLGPDGIIVSSLDVFCSRWSNGAKRWKVSSPFALVQNLTSTMSDGSTIISLCKLKPQENTKIVNMYVPLVCSLLTFHLLWFQNRCSHTFMLQPVGYYYVLIVTVRQCCWMQTRPRTDWFNKVYNTAKSTMTTHKKTVYVVTDHLKHRISPRARSSNGEL